jgi:hypothetical protein
MKYKTGKNIETSMSCLQGYVKTTYANIVTFLGDPQKSGDKVNAEWVIKFENGRVATIYDWKEPSIPKDEYEWHIGGYGDSVVYLVGDLLNAEAYTR